LPGQTAREAVERYVRPLQKALSCVTDAVLGHRGGYHPSAKPHVLTFAGTDGSVPLRGTDLNLAFIRHYSIVRTQADQSYVVRTAYYAYGLEDGETGREIFAYHWHPDGSGPIRYPHLHLEHGAQVGRNELTRGHLPTGRVALEDVLTFLIEQFNVKPRRNDWRKVLQETTDVFQPYPTGS